MARKYTNAILETECIGNSLLTINTNFLNLDTKTSELTSNIISTNLLLQSVSSHIPRLSALEQRTTNIEISANNELFTQVPLYCVIMYAGQNPAIVDFDNTGRGLGQYRKFALCNGNTHSVINGGSLTNVLTPNLMDRFVIGGKPSGVTSTGTRLIGANGGAETVTLGINEIPSHAHTASFVGDPLANHSHTYHGPNGSDPNREGYVPSGSVPAVNDPFETDNTSKSTSSDSAGTPSGTVTVQLTGGGLAHNNMPPFYALAYIMRIQ
jgi:microcystin-dependent protein